MRFELTDFGNAFSFKSRHINGKRRHTPHVHHFIEIQFVMEGTAELTVDTEKRILEKGDFAVIHPFRQHSLLANSKTKIWIGVFSDGIIKTFGILSPENKWGEDFVFRGSDSLVNYVKEHLPPNTGNIQKPIDLDSSLRYTVGAIFFAVMDEFSRNIVQTKKPEYDRALAKIYEYIEKHFRENICLKDLSKNLGYSQKYISQVLSTVPSSSFRQLLNERRIHNAIWWLLNSDESIMNISLNAGYQQQRTFYRAFKEQTGMTPCAFRKKHKQHKYITF